MKQNKIYALCDFELLQKFNVTLEQYLKIIEKHNIVYIQYRDKINPLDIKKQNLLFLRSNTYIPIIINDSLELLQFADGLHIGQEDLDELSSKFDFSRKECIGFLRQKHPNKILGLSTHNEQEIQEANGLDLDYIGLGAYRATSTKDVKNCLGENIISLATLSKHPVGAIGGVKLDDKIEKISYNVIGSALLK